ncbi:GntR family transcriptional regulator [Crossiella sp. CA198]|uniref:GntR family transcriptional regulator n=1 Tax=Crossiella sp. CA198 TaxID=3455607 RepID=UPI003F8CFEC2
MQLSPSAGHPYRALADRIVKDIREGALKPNDQLRPVRELAKNYGVTPATAQRAVNELVAEGYIRTVPGHGIFVRDSLPVEINDADLPQEVRKLREELEALRHRVVALEQPPASE